MDACIYPECGYPAVDGNGFCSHHHWVVRAETEAGFTSLRSYLKAWADFFDWCQTHDTADR